MAQKISIIILSLGLIILALKSLEMKSSGDVAKIQKLEKKLQDLEQLSRFLSLAEKITSCESSGEPRNYHINLDASMDVGLWQINSKYHNQQATKLGLDIFKPEDNYIYGLWLLRKTGTKPWKSSERCWDLN